MLQSEFLANRSAAVAPKGETLKIKSERLKARLFRGTAARLKACPDTNLDFYYGLLCIVAVTVLLGTAFAQSESVLYSFCSQSGCTDGASSLANLVLDKKGNFYGTTWEGGANVDGTVFKLTPAGTEIVLHSFPSQTGDGSIPESDLIMDKKGNLYGTTWQGGLTSCSFGCGTIFKVTRKGTETLPYSFGTQSGDGYRSSAGLVMDKQGNLYGTTVYGGAYNEGTVFKLSPAGTETVLYSLGSQLGDGYSPYGGLILDKTGNLYGTAYHGGAYGNGAVFKLTPSGTETVPYSFGSYAGDGANPYYGRLIMDKQGDLYGSTVSGGAYNQGTIFKLTPTGTEAVLYSFGSYSGDGSIITGGLVMDHSGNLYGTTEYGGAYNEGTVFKLTPAKSETVLYSFGSQSGDGSYPVAGVIMDGSGNLYGTTQTGGAHNLGTVFRVVP